LYNWLFFISSPGWASSMRIIILIIVPAQPAQMPRMKYRVPMSLWFDEHNQRIRAGFIIIVLRIRLLIDLVR